MGQRVLFIGLNYAPEHTGIAPYTSGMAHALTAAGWDVGVVTGLPHYPQWQVHAGYERGNRNRDIINGVPVARVPHPVPRNAGLARRLGMEIMFGLRAARARWNNPDAVVVVSPALFASVIVRLRAKYHGIPVLAWVQDIYTAGLTETGSAGGFATRAMRAVEGRFLRSCEATVVIHDRFAQYVQRELGVDPARVHTVRNWTHIGPSTHVDTATLRERFGWPMEDIVVLHTGNMGAKQDLANVVAAAARADQSGAPVRFVLVGGGRQRPLLEELAAHAPRLEVLPSVDDETYSALLGAADVLLVHERPGVTEMCVPSKLTSYFTAGRPVLAAVEAHSPSAFEVASADAGMRVPPGDPQALVAGALTLHGEWVESGGTRHNGGARYVREVLSRDAATKAFIAALNAVRASGHAPTRTTTFATPTN
ncbi:glycosyltransferase family 4 protein [Kocuria sp. cx-116]|uniref:glycosyltransferase family 4 protein n=1 Tax=Kocuria sp. cx-116 TaxID=2771378 RepID=UPI0016877201|nr:glycosyltransferase family 4 protein [Kocuria sp. cx-116]MBD2763053.1 glycosyltransferase family 4 protein [Kocuria sp. cx-116]